ncbi:MAG: glycosyltransferase family 2 protein [Deltaproteobacteria bacterium]|jgi:glycosyltransferase involved in cell wall biosynthesis|nr:glycosyltransferase family 2 protein [Deltaproteobacteria bacterium]
MMLNAVMCVWKEEDIIESTVKHAFAQGCSNVFIVDNASPDRTVENAVKAGATLASAFESKYFDEIEKITHMNTVVKNYNEQSNEEHIWWLYLDDDEFPNIDCDLTIFDFLKQLDSSVRAVQGYFYDHIPTHQPYYVSGYHPADFMQLSAKTATQKIPLLRYDKNKPHLYSAGGAHTFDTCGEMIRVASDVLQIHHFKYRRPENTKSRLKELCRKRSDGSRRMDLDAFMAKQIAKDKVSTFLYHYRRCQSEYNQNNYKIFIIDDLLYNYKNIVRFKSIDKLSASECHEYDMLLCQSIHYFFMRDYDNALFKFNDLLKITNDEILQLMITIKIAECLQFTDRAEALSLLKPMLKCKHTKIREYCIKQFQKIHEDKLFVKRENTAIEFKIQNYYGEFDKKFFL